MLETLLEIGPMLTGCRPPNLSRAPRVAVVTTTGGGAASVVDRLGIAGIETVTPGSDAPITDLTMGKKSATYGAVIGELLDFPGSDAVLAVVGSSAQFHPQHAVEPIISAAKRGGKPLAVFLTPQADKSLALLAEAGIAAFRTPEACADAFDAFFRWRTPRIENHEDPVQWPQEIPRKGALDQVQALTLFAALGVPVVEHQVVEAPDFTHALPYPVALKILSAQVAHKTEAGGVALGISCRQEFDVQLEKLEKITPRLLVQKMASGLAEAIVGYRDDPVVGPLVLVGAGGILAELYNDVVLRMAPVDEAGALEMIGQVKGFAALRGYRGLPKGDLQSLARALAALSRLALCDGRPVREAEANPVIVRHDGVVAVDALVVMKEA